MQDKSELTLEKLLASYPAPRWLTPAYLRSVGIETRKICIDSWAWRVASVPLSIGVPLDEIESFVSGAKGRRHRFLAV